MIVSSCSAIDVCLDWRLALDNIIQLGCQRVLTSGTCQSAFEGRFLIREMIDHVRRLPACVNIFDFLSHFQVGDKILIMPGAGVNADNIAEIIRITKATEYHTSASIVMKSAVDTSVKMGPADNIDIVRMTDTVKVRDIKEKLLR